MCFTAAGLSIGENGSIVAQQNVFYQTVGSFRVDKLLLATLIKHIIICKGFSIVGIIGFDQSQLINLLIDLDDGGTVAIFLFVVHGTDTNDDFDCFAHGMEGLYI